MDEKSKAECLQRVSDHVALELCFLKRLQTTFRQLGDFSLSMEDGSNTPVREDFNALVHQLDLDVERIQNARKQLQSKVSRMVGCRSQGTKSGVRLREILEQIGSPVADEIHQSLQRVSRNVAKTFGMLQARLQTMFIERQLVEATLEALGAGVIQETYDESGERLTVHPESHLETRS